MIPFLKYLDLSYLEVNVGLTSNI